MLFGADPLRMTGPGRVAPSRPLSSRCCEAFLLPPLSETREEVDPLAAFVLRRVAGAPTSTSRTSHVYDHDS